MKIRVGDIAMFKDDHPFAGDLVFVVEMDETTENLKGLGYKDDIADFRLLRIEWMPKGKVVKTVIHRVSYNTLLPLGSLF